MERNPEFYTPELLKSTYSFDGRENLYSKSLIDYFNHWITLQPGFNELKLELPQATLIPENIIWVDASEDGLPATRESRRVTGKGTVVNTRDELLKNLEGHPADTLVLSQCVKKECYDLELSREIEEKGSVTVPGPLTAPGSLFSDKIKTYDLLSENGKRWDLVARYCEINPQSLNPGQVASKILETADSDKETGSFFIKPPHGGGGLGGFRLIRVDRKGKTGYVIPDLSRVSGEFEHPHIVNLTVDPENPDAINELWWIYERFRSIEVLNKNYVHVSLENKKQLKKLLKIKEHKRIYSREEAVSNIAAAIEKFESKFGRRYHPLVSRYIDFGTWGLRAHFRMSSRGIQLETIYARLFQIRFEEEGTGYVGSDNISNKQTGELELGRLIPINELMVKAVGGEERLYSILLKGAQAMKLLLMKLSPELQNKVPVRVQFDLAPVAGLIGEGNADTARGFCIAQEWAGFVNNITEWFDDSVKYYSFRKSR